MRLFKKTCSDHFWPWLFFLVLLWSCSNRNSSTNTYSYELIRFEQIFFESHPDSLAAVEKQFPYFFPKNYPFLCGSIDAQTACKWHSISKQK